MEHTLSALIMLFPLEVIFYVASACYVIAIFFDRHSKIPWPYVLPWSVRVIILIIAPLTLTGYFFCFVVTLGNFGYFVYDKLEERADRKHPIVKETVYRDCY